MNTQRLIELTKRAQRACDTLDKILKEVAHHYPDANWYLDGSGNLNMMSGPAHEGQYATARQDRILFWVSLEADGGDW